MCCAVLKLVPPSPAAAKVTKQLNAVGYLLLLNLDLRHPIAAATDKQNAEGSKCYVLRSLLPAHLRRDVTDDPKDDALKALAMICCGLIEVSDGSLEEGEARLCRALVIVGSHDSLRVDWGQRGGLGEICKDWVLSRLPVRCELRCDPWCVHPVTGHDQLRAAGPAWVMDRLRPLVAVQPR